MPPRHRPDWETPLATFLIAGSVCLFIHALAMAAQIGLVIISLSRGY